MKARTPRRRRGEVSRPGVTSGERGDPASLSHFFFLRDPVKGRVNATPKRCLVLGNSFSRAFFLLKTPSWLLAHVHTFKQFPSPTKPHEKARAGDAHGRREIKRTRRWVQTPNPHDDHGAAQRLANALKHRENGFHDLTEHHQSRRKKKNVCSKDKHSDNG